jgi:hypothetical protein
MKMDGSKAINNTSFTFDGSDLSNMTGSDPRVSYLTRFFLYIPFMYTVPHAMKRMPVLVGLMRNCKKFKIREK